MAYAIPRDLLQRLDRDHPPVSDLDQPRQSFSTLALAHAIDCSGQTISSWRRQGRIPCSIKRHWGKRFTREDVATMGEHGLGEMGQYAPCEPGELKRQLGLKEHWKKPRRKAQKGAGP